MATKNLLLGINGMVMLIKITFGSAGNLPAPMPVIHKETEITIQDNTLNIFEPILSQEQAVWDYIYLKRLSRKILN
jgi:hypothetical protein